jgi:hypothetical protein
MHFNFAWLLCRLLLLEGTLIIDVNNNVAFYYYSAMTDLTDYSHKDFKKQILILALYWNVWRYFCQRINALIHNLRRGISNLNYIFINSLWLISANTPQQNINLIMSNYNRSFADPVLHRYTCQISFILTTDFDTSHEIMLFLQQLNINSPIYYRTVFLIILEKMAIQIFE